MPELPSEDSSSQSSSQSSLQPLSSLPAPTSTSHSTPPTSFGEALRRARLARGWTQAQLAERAGLSARGVNDLERGVRVTPRRDTLTLLADALGLSGDERAAFEAAAHTRPTPTHMRSTPLPYARRFGAALPIVGRQRELALIEALFTGAGPPLLLFTGEPGIGKTRLLQEAAFRAANAGWTVLAGGCHRRSGQEPYAPLVSALQTHLNGLPKAQLRSDLEGCAWLVRLLPELAEQTLAPLPNWALAAEQERRLMFDAVGRFLTNAATPAGIALVLDDLQWAGQDALDLLAMLVRTADAANLCILGAYRSTEVAPGGPLGVLHADLTREGLARQQRLGPLVPAAADALLNVLLPDRRMADVTLREQVLARAEGVPFFLVSCAQELSQEQSQEQPTEESQPPKQESRQEPGQRRLDVPWSVAQSIRQRVALLPDSTRALLELAAVAGRVVSSRTLVAGIQRPEEEVLEDLAVACRSGLLTEEVGDVYRFTHDLIRETVLADLSVASRAPLHRRVAEALERQPRMEQHAAELAWHYIRATRPERAVTYLEQAADQAQAMYAYSDAERYYRDLVACLIALDRSLDAARAREKLGVVLRTTAHYDEALATIEQAVATYEAAGAHEDVARALAQMGLAYASRGLPIEGSARLRRYLDLPSTQTLSPAIQASIFLALTQLYRIGGRYREMLAAAESAATQASLAHDVGLSARAQQERGTALLMLGQNAAGAQALEAALSSIESLNDPAALARALNTLSVVREAHGDFDSARQYLERAVAHATRSADPVLIAFMLYRRATNAFDRGDWSPARADYEQALTMLRAVGQSWALPYALRGLGMLELAAGDQTAAIDTLEEGLAEAQTLGDVQVTQNIQIVLAEADMLAGQPERVIARLAHLLERVEQESDVLMLLSPLAWAYDALGDSARADALLERAMAVARADDDSLGLGDAFRTQALTQARRSAWESAEVAAQSALAVYTTMGAPYGQAKTLYTLGSVYQAWGKATQAYDALQRARAICQQLGERLYAERVERMLADLGQSLG